MGTIHVGFALEFQEVASVALIDHEVTAKQKCNDLHMMIFHVC